MVNQPAKIRMALNITHVFLFWYIRNINSPLLHKSGNRRLLTKLGRHHLAKFSNSGCGTIRMAANIFETSILM